jgi:hypothetical protein
VDAREADGKGGMKSWIYEPGIAVFVPYGSGLSAEELVQHTAAGETIVHRADDGLVLVIRDQQLNPWPEGEPMSVGDVEYEREQFAMPTRPEICCVTVRGRGNEARAWVEELVMIDDAYALVAELDDEGLYNEAGVIGQFAAGAKKAGLPAFWDVVMAADVADLSDTLRDAYGRAKSSPSRVAYTTSEDFPEVVDALRGVSESVAVKHANPAGRADEMASLLKVVSDALPEPSRISYRVVTAGDGRSVEFPDACTAAEAYVVTTASERPFVVRVAHFGTEGRREAVCVALTAAGLGLDGCRRFETRTLPADAEFEAALDRLVQPNGLRPEGNEVIEYETPSP